jgi:dolichol-phosphate mannosyltransferase
MPKLAEPEQRVSSPLMKRVAAPRVSVAIPLYNEEAGLPELYRRLNAVLSMLPGGPHEIVFVDDGSRDGTLELLETLSGVDSRVVAVALSRNFGHQAAIDAALDHTTGDVVVVMDGDLQDTPESIPDFLDHYAQGHDVVYAVRVARKEHWLLKSCYAAYYRLAGAMADIELPHDAGDFALMSRRVVDQLRATPERHRYLRGLRAWVGFKQKGIEVERAARHAGSTKYSLRKLLRLATDGLLSFSLAPVRAASFCGAFCLMAGLALGTLAALRVLPTSEAAWIVAAVAFFSGLQLLFLGVIGEYLGRVYDEVRGRPRYIVERVLRNAE